MNYDKAIYIIILENDKEMAGLLQLVISQRFGPVVFNKFTNGTEAWKAIEATTPDLFIADSTHEGMDLAEILANILNARKEVPFIAVSGGNYAKTVAARYALTGKETVTLDKPFSTEDIQAQVGRLISRRRNATMHKQWAKIALALTAVLMVGCFLWGSRLQHATQNGILVIYNKYTGKIVFPKRMVEYQRQGESQ